MDHPVRDYGSFELVFCLFLFAGVFKTHPVFDKVPVDLTQLLFAASGVVAIYLFYSRRVAVRRTAAVVVGLFTLFVAWALFSLLWAEFDAYTIGKAIRLPTLTLWALAGAALVVSSSPRRVRRFGNVIVALAGIVVVELAYRYSTVGDLWTIPPFHSGSYLLSSTLLGAGVVSVVALYPRDRSRVWILAITALSGIYLSALLLPGSRSALLAALSAVGVYVLLSLTASDTYTHVRLPAWVSYVSIGGVISGSMAVLLLNDHTHTISRLRVLFRGGGESTHTRFELYNHALDLFLRYPLTGTGLGDFGLVVTEDWPHNLILELAAELGLVGLILLGGVIVAVLTYWSRLRRSPTRRYVFALCTYFGALSLVTGDLNSSRFLFMSIGLLILDDSQRDRE